MAGAMFLLYLPNMGTKRLILVLLSVVAMAAIVSCSPATPTQAPTPTPTISPQLSVKNAGALMRALVTEVPGCDPASFDGASFAATWEPATRSWLVQVTAPEGLSGSYRIFEERGFAFDAVNQLIPGKC